jgi:protease IV
LRASTVFWAILWLGITLSALLVVVLLLPSGGTAFDFGAEGVGLIRLTGDINDSDEFLRALEPLRRDRIKALVVRIDTPGGGVAASQEIYEGLKRYRKETGRPVVASLGGVAASGGYYVACAADRIVANPGTMTGSIGVILTFANAEGLLDRIGIRFRSIKSGPMKDEGAFWRELTEEERVVLQGMVDDVYEQFLETVEAGRKIPREEILPLADGRALSGRQAFTAGLVDTLGDLSFALDEARRLGGLPKDSPVVRPPQKRESLLSWLQRSSSRLPGIVQPGLTLEYRLAPPLVGDVVGRATR